ncbi:prepilin-type N-terminal cleavage/methylation domain-containing protein [Pseudomonas sp. Pseusp122]|uniref:prepilin-type N-terminal cleavage/methylation domain-containing protein n=1 Tax=unclassified Pseudomonas TaxID=196821 RepID=UPI0039A6963E
MKMPAPRQQRGLSLIELMVAMLIGTFLILGITEIFINNQKSYLFQQNQVGNQENGRFALTVLSQELSKAGYRSLPIDSIAASNGAVAGCNFPAGAAVVAISQTSLCIQYQAATRTDTGCQGTALANAGQIVKPYGQVNPVIVEKIALDTATNSLTCTTSAGVQPLVTGISDIRFDYGSGNDKSLTTFATSPTQIVGAVRYAALMQSIGGATIRDTTTVPAALTEWNSRYGTTLNDTTKLYQIVQGTVMLRNQLP